MQTVVGAAVVRGGRVLSARRTAPAAAAGRWEFPGGKVEPDEEPDAALVREVSEELGCRVEVVAWLAATVPIGTAYELRVGVARLVAGEPRPREHDLVRWLGADELDDVDWLDADRPFLPELRDHLSERMGPVRGIFFDEDHAAAVAARLAADGYDARVVRERLAGEDDDEDHPWAVLTDAPEVALEILVDEHDGWLDLDDPADSGEPLTPPLDLPSGPRRLKRPQ